MQKNLHRKILILGKSENSMIILHVAFRKYNFFQYDRFSLISNGLN